VYSISEHLNGHIIEEVLRDFSNANNIAVFLFDREGNKALSYPPEPEAEGIAEGIIKMPIVIRDELVGYIGTSGHGSSQIEFLTKIISLAIEREFEISNLSQEVARLYEELSTMWKLSSRLGAVLDVDKICRVLADEVMNICPSENISVMLVGELIPYEEGRRCEVEKKTEEAKRFLFSKVSLVKDSEKASKMVLPLDMGVIVEACSKREGITICDFKPSEGFTYPISKILIVPLIVEDETIGVIVASDKLNGEEFYSTEIKLISSIASECAISIKKALLFDEIREMLFSTAEAFSRAVEAKDPNTYGHSKRVSEYSSVLATALGLDTDMVDRVRLAALLHDIGKIGTPEVILDKETGLDPEETARMRDHPSVGARMIENIKKMRDISRWICLHHERWDGSGYPLGLRGEEIPLASRIIAVADFYDAITSDRPYRKAISKSEAIEIMRGLSGKHFDPKILDLFERVFG